MKTLDDAVRAKERIEPDLLRRPGVTGIDAGFRPDARGATDPVIRVYVADRKKAPPLPAEVDGFAVVVIERRFEPH